MQKIFDINGAEIEPVEVVFDYAKELAKENNIDLSDSCLMINIIGDNACVEFCEVLYNEITRISREDVK